MTLRQSRLISPSHYLKAAAKAYGLKKTNKGKELDNRIAGFSTEIAPVITEKALLAREVYQLFDKNNHSA